MVVDSSKYEEFLKFDVATDDSGHYFLNKNNPSGDCFTNASSEVYNRIVKDLLILKKNLPKNITVRIYKHRIDLFRAVIVGAAGTACHDGLFFFDFAFPSDYPLRHPKFCFWFRSPFSLASNANANGNGNANANARSITPISLPDSWWGCTIYKKWNPSNSTVLQLLIHLQNHLPDLVLTVQSRVLNENKQLVFKKCIVANNDDVFVASCKRMLVLVRNPPNNFEAFVDQHFRNRGEVILKACKAYKNGDVQVGDYREGEEYYDVIEVSDAFKASIETLYPQLFTAFMELGDSSVSNFVKQIDQLDTKTVSSSAGKEVTDKVRHGISNKIVGTMMKIFGLKKKLNAKA